jgi:heat shock protein HtpX
VFVGLISHAADLAWRGIRHASYGRTQSRSSRNPIVLVFIAAVVLSIGYVLALMLRLAVSRRREFMADAGAVELTKNPDAMIAALQKISGHSAMPEVPPDVRQMFIDNPPGLAFFEIFATHPPIEARIGALQALGGQALAKGDSIIPPSS